MLKRFRLIMMMLMIWVMAFIGYGIYELESPINIQQAEVVELNRGSSLAGFFRKIESNHWIDDARWVMIYAKVTGLAKQAKAGEYELTPGMTTKEVLLLLVEGKSIQYFFTLVEGQTMRETLAKLKDQPRIQYDLPESPKDLMPAIGLSGHYEGRFFPDTYSYTSNTKASEILIRAQVRLERVLAEEWQKKAANLPYKDAYEALIMASIVEKETAAPVEREQIAGVFVRRLQKNMRLETDPTVIYGMGDKYNGNIRRKDLRTYTPYNTYRIKGLPPTPIALVGREAIHAALNPADGTELYFVAKGDGRHQFSSTLVEHNRAVREYQIRRRSKDYRSTPVEE